MTQAPHLQSGEAAEHLACEHLQQQGLQLIQRQYRRKTGEIDLIMRDQQTLVFVEVRFRAKSTFGGALASINPAKQKKLWRTAMLYLQRYKQPPACRFDVVTITQSASGQLIFQQWIPNAFQGDL